MPGLVLIPLLLILAGVCAPRALAQDSAPTPGLDSNAALQYWQAFAQLPDLNGGREKLLEEWATVPFDAATLELIEASRASLNYLRRGAALDECDWGLDYNDGVKLLLPHLAKARTLARLAALHGRHEFTEGRAESGIEDAIAIMALARHVERDPIMIGLLVGYSIEGAAIDLLAPHVADSKAVFEDAVAELQSLPAGATVQQTLRTEKEFMAMWMIRTLREVDQVKRDSWRELWQDVLMGTEASESVKGVETLDQAVAWLEELVPVYDELAQRMELPAAEFDAQYAEYSKATNLKHPLASTLLPPLEKVLAKERRAQARRALLLSAIAVANGGPEELSGIDDPFGDGPFEYRALDHGFELTSKLHFEGKPVTLRVGAP